MKNNTFETARIKLTLWYLVIIIPITIFFSSIIYNLTINRLRAFVRDQNSRVLQFRNSFPLRNGEPAFLISTTDLKNGEKEILTTLISVNIAIFLIVGGGGYFLAGQTLKPIRVMIDDQNNFISSSSHELRTPITVLRAEMEASLLEKHISDQMARGLIKSNLEELSNLQQLINHLLQITRINDGNIGLVSQIEIKDIVGLAHKKVLPLAQKKKININLNLNDAKINGSKDRLVEVLVILLDNAIKYSSAHSQISVESQTKNKRLHLTVADHGCGISSTDLPHIFEKFYRADKSRSQTDGFGLGLAIAKKIIEAHDGSISVTSQLSQGTVFEINLPLSKN